MIPFTDAALKTQLTTHEGRRSLPYADTKGNITIGIGHNLTAKGLPQSIIDELYDFDVQNVIDDINEALPWVTQLPLSHQRVVIDIGFNAGVNGLLGFHRMLAALQRGDVSTAANEVTNSDLAPARAQRLAAILRGSNG